MPAKSSFQGDLPASFRLIETMHFRYRIRWLEDHVGRMERSAKFFEIPFEKTDAISVVKSALSDVQPDEAHKVRLTLDLAGNYYVTASPLTRESNNSRVVCISNIRIDSDNPFFHHKTTRREMYDREYAKAKDAGFYDVLFLNDAGFITEGSRHNIFIKKDGLIYTPPLLHGALEGIYRKKLMERNTSIEEKAVQLEDLFDAGAIWLSNAVRGLRKVEIQQI